MMESVPNSAPVFANQGWYALHTRRQHEKAVVKRMAGGTSATWEFCGDHSMDWPGAKHASVKVTSSVMRMAG